MVIFQRLKLLIFFQFVFFVILNVHGGLTYIENKESAFPAPPPCDPQSTPTMVIYAIDEPTTCGGPAIIYMSFTNVPDGIYTISYNQGSFTNVVVTNGLATITTIAGSYYNMTITVSGCTSSNGNYAVINDPNPPLVPVVQTQTPTCSTDGFSTIVNYNSNWVYTFNPVGPTIQPNGVITGAVFGQTYTVTAAKLGCTNTSPSASFTNLPQVNITPVLTVDTIIHPNICGGNGAIHILTSGVPDGFYTINYTGGSFSNVHIVNDSAQISAPAGIFNDLVINYGCNAALGVNAIVTDPSGLMAPTISVTTPPTCANPTGIIGVSAPLGTGLSYILIGTNPVVVADTNQTGIFSGLTQGTYTVQVLDANGCLSSTATAVIGLPIDLPTLTIYSIDDPSTCNSLGTIYLSFTHVPDGIYNIPYHSGTFNNVVVTNGLATIQALAGTYNNLIITVGNCSSSTNGNYATLADPNPPVIPIVHTEAPTCTDDGFSTVLNYNSNYIYTFTPSGPTIQPNGEITGTVLGQTYTITAAKQGCITSSPAVSFTDLPFNNITPVIVVDTIINPTSCGTNGLLRLLISNVPDGIYTISYNGGNFTNVSLVSGIAQIATPAGIFNDLMINYGCNQANGVNAIVSDPSGLFAPTVTVTQTPTCAQPFGVISATTSSTGAFQYVVEGISPVVAAVSNTNGNFSNLLPGDYIIYLLDNNGCQSATTNFTIVPPIDTPSLTIYSIDVPTHCGGSATIHLSFTNVPDGVYDIAYHQGVFNNVTVTNGTATITVPAGQYNNLVITVGNCSSSTNGNYAHISEPTAPNNPKINTSDPDCTNDGESIISNYDQGVTYTFIPSGPTINSNGEIINAIPGQAYGVVASEASCPNVSDTIYFINLNHLDVQATLVVDSIIQPKNCETEGTIFFSFTNVSDGMYNIVYSGGILDSVIVNSNSAAVTVSIGNYNNLSIHNGYCASSAGVHVAIVNSKIPPFPSIVTENANCDGDGMSRIMNYNYIYDYIFTPAGPTVSLNGVIQNVIPGIEYSLVVENDQCSSDTAFFLNEDWNLLDCDGDGVTNGDEMADGTDPKNPCSFILAHQTLPPSQAWLDEDCDGDGFTNGEELQEGTNPLDPCDPTRCTLDIPNTLSPNGDGINDAWVIEGIQDYPGNEVFIYNRWGNLVYSMVNYTNDWTGFSNSNLNIGGSDLPSGTYYYVVDSKDEIIGVLKGYIYLQR